MIFLRIASGNEGTVERIAELLLKERLVIDVNIKRNIDRLVVKEGKLFCECTTLMTSKTKGLLFSEIDELIKSRFPEESLEIYSLPIVHMDWDEAMHLREEIKTV